MIINLIDKEFSDLSYNIITFSDGQKLVEVNTSDIPKDYNGTFTIISRASWSDLEIISSVVHILRNNWNNEIGLIAPYIGGRSDRRFNEDQPHYLKEVYAQVLNSLNFNYVTTLDPHSDVLEATINRLEIITNETLVEGIVSKLIGTKALVVPDGGALKKAWNISKYFDGMLVCEKHRDIKTGKILGINVPSIEEQRKYDNLVVVDDICDGGATFTQLAKKLDGDLNLILIVSHGIFSKGFSPILGYDSVYTTNSVKDFEESPSRVTIIDSINLIMNA